MTFATEKDKPNSQRFMLVKIIPARYVSIQLGADGGGVYSMAWSVATIDHVERNGVTLTETTGTPATNDEWSLENGTFKVKTAIAPSANNVVVIFYNLFFTSNHYRIATIDPDDANTDEIHWEPRLLTEPAVKQSVRDIISGVISTSITNMSFINTDNFFQQYLTDDDSFNEKKVKCWLCINTVENRQKVFEGRVRKISLNQKNATITLYDIFSLLDQPCLMGDTADDSYYLRTAGSFATVFPDNDGTPIPYIAGVSAPYSTKDDDQLIKITDSNKYLDFVDNGGTLAVTLATQSYTVTDLRLALQGLMETASPSYTYDVDYSEVTRKFTFTSNSPTFELLWSSGANAANNCKGPFGFVSTDLTSGGPYTSPETLQVTEYVDLDKAGMLQAICTSFSGQKHAAANLTWGVCRVNSSGLDTISFGTIVSGILSSRPYLVDPVTGAANLYSYWKVTGTPTFQVGDDFKVSDGFANITYHRVVFVGDFPVNADTFQMAAVVVDGGTMTGALTVSQLDAISVVIVHSDGTEYFPFKGRDYSISEVALASGNIYVSVTFFQAIKTSLSLTDNLSPQDYKVYFRTRVASDNLHSDVLKQIAVSSGMATNVASFAAAGSALAINAQFSIPQIDESDFGSFRTYAEAICKSTLGILFANSDFELQYALLSAPTSADITDASSYLDDSLSISVDYNDVTTELVAHNPHNSSGLVIDAAKSPNETVGSEVSRHLHGVTKSVKFRHVLETITDRIQDIFDVLSNRLAIYEWEVATDNLDSSIGDDMQLDSPHILGGLTSKDLKIISLDKSADAVKVEATDLLDI